MMLQESLTNVQGRLVEMARENRAALSETHDAASRALTAVHTELSQLQKGQDARGPFPSRARLNFTFNKFPLRILSESLA